MKAVIPTAGQGTRLFPHTHTKPKAMVRLAGQPILGHILENISETRVDEIIVVVGGPMQEQIIEYVRSEFGEEFRFEFVEQESPEGLGHSIYQTESVARGDELLITLGDMLFERGYRDFIRDHESFEGTAASIGVTRVEDPTQYGVVQVDDDGRIVDLVEKPDTPPSDLAMSGVYIVEDSVGLFDALGHLVEHNERGAGNEFQLTDAFGRMVEQGSTLRTFDVKDWYDCGRPETLLEANRVLLEEAGNAPDRTPDNAVVIPPVDIGSDVEISASVVGPNVSIDDGSSITNSIVQNSIIGQRTTLEAVNMTESIVGDNTTIEEKLNELNVGDNSNISL